MSLLGLHVDAASVPLPDSPDGSLVQVMPTEAKVATAIGSSEAPALPSGCADTITSDNRTDDIASTMTLALQSRERKRSVSIETKPMSPEKAALAAMFDSIKMPPPTSPSKSPRKASGSSILSSPSKQLARETAPTLFTKTTSPSTSPSKVGSTDSAASRPYSRDSPLRRPVIISSSSSPGKGLRAAETSTKNASTPLSPAPASSSAGSRLPRMRPSMLASSSSPSAKLSDLSLNLDTTGTQELLFNQDASFLAAAANTAADVTIDDSFDVSRAKARIKSSPASSSTAGTTRRSSSAKFGGYKAKPRCSMVPEDAVAEIKPSTPGRRSNALGLRGLGIGKVIKNAAGDDTIELNLTGSFIGNSSIIGSNLMDESAEASLLFGNNSFSVSQTKSPKKGAENEAMQPKNQQARRGSSDDDDDDDDDEEEEDFERDAKNLQKWATETARKAQLGRQVVDKTPMRGVSSARTGMSTVTRTSAAPSTVTKPISRIAPRTFLVTPTAGSRLLQPRAPGVATTVKPEPALSRSGSASSGLASSQAPAAHASSTQLSCSVKPGSEARTPMRSRRKSTFTSTRPPVSGPARRRESLAAAAVVQAHPIPPLPSLGPATPGRTRTASTPSTTASSSPGMKTPTAASRTIPKPRASLTGRTSGVLPTPRASAPATAGSAAGAGVIPRPRASLTSSTARPSVGLTRTPSARTATARSASLATPTARPATSRASAIAVDATPVAASGMRKSASQPHALDAAGGVDMVGETPTTAVARPRTLVPRASMSRIGGIAGSSRASALGLPRTTGATAAVGGGARAPPEAFAEAVIANNALVTPVGGTASKIGVPATRRPSVTASARASGGFGFKPRTSAVYVGATRAPALLLDGEDKEN